MVLLWNRWTHCFLKYFSKWIFRTHFSLHFETIIFKTLNYIRKITITLLYFFFFSIFYRINSILHRSCLWKEFILIFLKHITFIFSRKITKNHRRMKTTLSIRSFCHYITYFLLIINYVLNLYCIFIYKNYISFCFVKKHS